MKGFLVSIIITICATVVTGCGGSNKSNEPGINANPDLNPDFSNLKPYMATGPHASVIVDCVAIESSSDSCSLQTLPPIGQEHPSPTVADILNHVVVSHTWMGDRMRNLLEIMPPEILLLLRAATAIVIDDDIRPAYFQQATGAIYIDPAYLWLTNTEKATISQHEDFRSDYGNDLQFKRMWRYVINNAYAWQSYPLDGMEERLISDTLVNTTWLFYHELAHANDCLPPSQMTNLVSTLSYYDNYLSILNSGECIHDQLVNWSPLSSSVWFALAEVLYKGADSTAAQRAMSPDDVGLEFSMDIANDTYSYSSLWEDTAMVFEAILMKHSFNADRDMAIIPYFDDFDCNFAPIKWGQRGRLGDPLIIPRAEFVVAEILPSIDFSSFFASQPLATQIPVDTSWCTLDYSSTKLSGYQKTTESMRQRLANERDIK